MNKKRLILIIAAVLVLAALAAAMVVLMNDGPEQVPTGLIVVSEVSPADVTRMAVTYGGRATTLTRSGDAWIFDQSGAPADFLQVESALTQLAYLYASDIVDENIQDLQAFGLGEPQLTVELRTVQGSYAFSFGEQTTDKKNRYMTMRGDNTLYLFSEEQYAQIESGIQAFHDLSISFDASSLAYMNVIKSSGEHVEMSLLSEDERIGNEQWKLAKPFLAVGNNDLANLVKSLMTPARFAGYAGDDIKEEYAIGDGGSIELRDGNGSVVSLQVGGNAEDGAYYCTMDGREGVYTIYAGYSELLNVDIENCVQRNMLLVDQAHKSGFILELGEDTLQYDSQSNELNGKALAQEQSDALFAAMGEIAFDGMTEAHIPVGEETGGMSVEGITVAVFHTYRNEFLAVSRYDGSAPVYVRREKLEELILLAKQL